MLPSFSVKKPFTILVAVILVLILGGTSATKMTTSLIPELDLPYVAVLTTYSGASPEEVETSLTTRIESALATTSGVEDIVSISSENMSMVAIQFVEGTSMDGVMLEMREKLDLYAGALPEDAGTPMLMKLDMNALPIAVLTVDIDGANRAAVSEYVTDTVAPAFESIDGVASVSAMGMLQSQVNVILQQEKLDEVNDKIAQLESFAGMLSTSDSSDPTSSLSQEQLVALMSGDMSALTGGAAGGTDEGDDVLTRDMVVQILKANNFSYPNGYITEDGVDYLVRTGDAYASVDDIKNLLLLSVPEADLEVRLGDIADIALTDNADSTYTKVNGNDAIVLTLQKQSESSTSDVAHLVTAKSAELTADNPDLTVTPLMDQGLYIDMVVNTVIENLLYGAILAVIVLLLFLRSWKLTGVIALSIPLSLVVALILMYFSGITLNLLSLSGLALGVGMLVDNSIVVIENIYRKRQEGQDVKQAAIEGAKQVSGAIIASTLTTCAVFLPFAFATGITKQLFVDLALTVCFSLAASLIVALSFVPMVCSGALRGTNEKPHRLFDRVQEWYGRVIERALAHKALPLIIVFALFAGAAFAVTQMGTQFFPESDSSQLSASVRFESDMTYDERVEELESVLSIIKGIEGVKTLGVTMSDSGSTSTFSLSSMTGGGGDSTAIYVVLDDDRPASSMEIASIIDERCAQAGHSVTSSGGSMDISTLTGSGVEVAIYGENLDTLREVASDFAAELAEIEGLENISDGFNKPTPEMRVIVDKDAAIAKGLTVSQVYSTVSKLLAETSSSTTLSEEGSSFAVYVRQDTDTPPVLDDLENLTVYSSISDEDVPITDIASIEEAQGYTSIAHDGQMRCVTVSAGIADGYNVGKVGAIVEDLVDDFDAPRGYKLVAQGENETINDAMGDLVLTLILAIIFVYLVMVAQFQSFRYPFIIMFTLPLCYTGGIAALLICGMPLSIVAVVGLVLLTGIVVNNGIVFVDYANQMRQAGMSKHDALVLTGKHRLRPILMTALTTIIAMLAMALGTGQSAEMSQPMAIVIIGGLMYATALTLIIVPIMYDILAGKGKDSGVQPTPDDLLPASARYDEVEPD